MRNWRDMDRSEVEAVASGRTTGGRLDVGELGAARAELARRDQEYAEQQEQARQEFEREMERSRAEREKTRQEFDASVARENRKAARETAKLQAAAMREAAERQIRIVTLAVWAVVASAFAAMFAFAITVIHALR
jgi:hypothetical protein